MMQSKKLVFFMLFLCAVARAQSRIDIPPVAKPPCEAAKCADNVGVAEDSADPETDDRDQSPGTEHDVWGSDAENRDRSLSKSATVQTDRRTEQGRDYEGDRAKRPQPARRGPRVPEKPTEFQRFIYSSTGEKLPIYGRNLFDENVPSTFAPVDRAPVPAEYTVGPGDELLIRLWGQIDLEAKVVVDRNGEIYLPKVGTIRVAGLKYEEVERHLKSNIGRLFKNFDLSVNLGRLRSIQVFVVGRAKRPGAYTVSSLSTLVNALFASGGPDANGSMRHITLRRREQVVTEFDLYELLAKGDKSKDVLLQPGDVIYIPPVGPQVAICGSVNLPAVYELRDGTSVGEQLEIAGGLSTTADSSRAILERIENRSTRKVEEFTLDAAGLGRKLRDADLLRVFPVSPRFENAVTVRGNVAQPGRYAWRPGMHFRDLIPSRDAVITREYWAKQNALGLTDGGWTANAAQVSEQAGTDGDEKFKELGKRLNARRRFNQDGWDSPTNDEPTKISRNAAEVNWDYAVIQRLNPEDLSSRLIPFNLGRAIAGGSSDDNLALEPGDVITIFSQADMAVPVARRTKFVRLEGEVSAAGVYRVEPGETLRDLVIRAGGLTPKAYLFAADFRRESTQEDQQKQLEIAADQMEKDLHLKAMQAAAALSPEERTAALLQIENDRAALQRFRNARPTGRVVLPLKPTDDAASALPPLELEDGDTLTVPARPTTVAVVGSVYNKNAFVFEPGKSLNHYMRKAGGTTRDADPGRIFVIRADGSVTSKQMQQRAIWAGSFESMALIPGDTVVVPQKIRTTSVLRGIRDWSQVFAQFALGAAAIKVIAP